MRLQFIPAGSVDDLAPEIILKNRKSYAPIFCLLLCIPGVGNPRGSIMRPPHDVRNSPCSPCHLFPHYLKADLAVWPQIGLDRSKDCFQIHFNSHQFTLWQITSSLPLFAQVRKRGKERFQWHGSALRRGQKTRLDIHERCSCVSSLLYTKKFPQRKILCGNTKSEQDLHPRIKCMSTITSPTPSSTKNIYSGVRTLSSP